MQSIISAAKPVIILYDIIFFFGFLYALIQGLKYRPHLALHHGAHEVPTIRRSVAREAWEEIRRKFNTGSPEAMRIAIIEADKFVDTILKNAGYKGEHMAERLEKILREDITSVDQLWEAHRYRNEVVHSPDFVLIEGDARRMLENYESFLREVHILEIKS